MKKHSAALTTGLSLLYCLASGSGPARAAQPCQKGHTCQQEDATIPHPNVWDNWLSWKHQWALGGYTHIKDLFLHLPCDNPSEEMREVGRKFREILTDTRSGREKLNEAFAKGLEAALTQDEQAGGATRARIIALFTRNPAGLSAAIDRVAAEPSRLREIVAGVPLPPQKKAVRAPKKP
jgi:hypothetical protein